MEEAFDEHALKDGVEQRVDFELAQGRHALERVFLSEDLPEEVDCGVARCLQHVVRRAIGEQTLVTPILVGVLSTTATSQVVVRCP